MLVGKQPSQQRFTVHRDLLVQRSEFFRAARSSRWTESNQPTDLEDHDPDTFSTYLHCLYFGVKAIKDRLSVIAEQHGATNRPAFNSDQSSHNGTRAGNDAFVNGEEHSSSESSSGTEYAGVERQNKQRSTDHATPKSHEIFTVLVDGKEKEATATLFVGNLSWTTEEKTLEQFFVEFGQVRRVRIIIDSKNGRSRGHGYVEFASAERAANALQARTGSELDGRALRLDFARPRQGRAGVSNLSQQKVDAQKRIENKSHVSGVAADSETNAVHNHQIVKDEASTVDYNTNYNEEADDVDDARIRTLIKLYVLADNLIDLHTANLVTDKFVQLVDTLEKLPGPSFTHIVYECTPAGSPLRALFRDFYMHEGSYIWDKQNDFCLPVEFLQDFIIETSRIQRERRNEIVYEVFRIKTVSRPTGYYHQKSRNSRITTSDRPSPRGGKPLAKFHPRSQLFKLTLALGGQKTVKPRDRLSLAMVSRAC